MSAPCLIGIGCDDHGDQIAGLLVARTVAAHARDVVAVHESAGSPAHLVRTWEHAGDVIVVEAMPGAVAGAIERCRVHPRPLGFGCSPTRLSPELREALAFGPLPQRLTVITIAGQCFAPDAPPSPPVAAAADEVALRVIAELAPLAQRPMVVDRPTAVDRPTIDRRPAAAIGLAGATAANAPPPAVV